MEPSRWWILFLEIVALLADELDQAPRENIVTAPSTVRSFSMGQNDRHSHRQTPAWSTEKNKRHAQRREQGALVRVPLTLQR
jgi:hypothetical protein